MSRAHASPMSAPALVGVDIGGTFTDLVAWAGGRLRTFKLPSTPPDYGRAVLDGLAALGAVPTVLSHGSTVATNALLERRGARCGLLTTAGFRDVLAIGRQARPALYDLDQPAPEPLVPRERRLDVPERVSSRGEVLGPLDEAALVAALDALADAGVESVAVCFLFSFLHPAHERRAAQLARERGFAVSASVDILPEFREYERCATTVINAYVAPLMSRYLDALQAGLGAVPLRVMQSNGGCIDAGTAGREAVRTVLSGPAAGVVGAWGVAQAAGVERLITFDMGGTSTDVAVLDGRLPLSTATRMGGLPIGVPVLDIHTVGAGGGSLARRDPGGALLVGPQSASAVPGPACYARGGDQATVTDAHVVLGRIPEDRFLGGRMPLDAAAARAAVERLARELALTPEACALGIIEVANAAMERAIRVMSVERGLDPRGFALCSFGGAGGLHAADLARRLGVQRVLCPPHPGALSALGLLLADVVRDGARTVMAPLEALTAHQLDAWFGELAAAERAALGAQGLERVEVERLVDVRYRGQSFELLRPCPDASPAAIAADFHRAHAERYGYRRDGAPIELVTLRIRAVGRVDRPALDPRPLSDPDPSPARVGTRRCVFDEPVDATIYDLEALHPGHRVPGPAILAGEDTTLLVPPDFGGWVDAWGNLVLERT